MKKQVLRWMMAALLVLAIVPMLSVYADEGDLLITDKTTYEAGEPILVTARGSGKDWVGLYLAEDVPGQQPSIWWYYVDQDGIASGDEVDLRNAPCVNYDRPHLIDVPEGEYKVLLLANDGYEVLAEISITVVAAETEPVPTVETTAPVTEPATEPATEPVTEPMTEPTTIESATDEATDSATDAETTIEEMEEIPTAEPTEAGTADVVTEPIADADGCASTVGVGMLFVLMFGGAILLRRRRD